MYVCKYLCLNLLYITEYRTNIKVSVTIQSFPHNFNHFLTTTSVQECLYARQSLLGISVREQIIFSHQTIGGERYAAEICEETADNRQTE